MKQFKESKKKIKEAKECKYDLDKIEGGAIYLTRTGDKPGSKSSIMILPHAIDHFMEMGKEELLEGKAFVYYVKLLGGLNVE
jgi:hypothetical protein